MKRPHPVGPGRHLHVEPLALVLHDPEHERQVVLRRVRQRPAHRARPPAPKSSTEGTAASATTKDGRAGRRRRRPRPVRRPASATHLGLRLRPPRVRRLGAGGCHGPSTSSIEGAGAATSPRGADGRSARARRRRRSPRRRPRRRKPWRTPAPPNSARPERTHGASRRSYRSRYDSGGGSSSGPDAPSGRPMRSESRSTPRSHRSALRRRSRSLALLRLSSSPALLTDQRDTFPMSFNRRCFRDRQENAGSSSERGVDVVGRDDRAGEGDVDDPAGQVHRRAVVVGLPFEGRPAGQARPAPRRAPRPRE